MNHTVPRRVRHFPIDKLISELDGKLKSLEEDYGDLDLRGKVLRLVELDYNTRCLSVSVIREHGINERGAKGRIRAYLLQHVGTVIDGSELRVVSSISEYARRIRELRKEEGYKILTGASPDPETGVELRPDEYLLTSPEPDTDAARRWHVANRIRRSAKSVQDKLLQYLQENVNKVVTTEELAYVAKDKTEFPRRVRELRTEKGYPVATRFTGRPDLGMGEYILLSSTPTVEPHDRYIPAAVEKAVFQRDNFTCRNPECCWTAERWSPADPRFLELHHLHQHADRGPNTEENLIVLLQSLP